MLLSSPPFSLGWVLQLPGLAYLFWLGAVEDCVDVYEDDKEEDECLGVDEEDNCVGG